MPLFIVTSCLFASFAVPAEHFADRCSITVTLLLAQVAFKYVVSDKLPNIDYLTYIDQYVFLCFLVAFFIIILQTLIELNLLHEPYVAPVPFTAFVLAFIL